MIALTVRHYFLVVNLMAILPGLWVLALAQGFLDMSLPVRRLGVNQVASSATCRNAAHPSFTDIKISNRNLEIVKPLREEMVKLPPVSGLCNYPAPQYASLE